MSYLPELSDLDAALFKADAMMGAAEAHGALCGMLCARGTTGLSTWSDHVLGEQDSAGTGLHEAVHLLSGLHQTTLEQLNDAMADFHLLLPDDDDSLSERVEALANWCQGFVYGLAAGGIKEETELPADSQEIIKDMIEISRAGYDDFMSAGEAEDEDGDANADEIAYMEITEYVRTGILLINEELQPLQSTNVIH